MSSEFQFAISLFTPILLAVIGFGVNMVLREIRAIKDDMKAAQEEHKEFVRKEECRLHREEILRRIEEGMTKRGG